MSPLYSMGEQSERFVGIMALTVLRSASRQAVSRADQRSIAASLAYLPTSPRALIASIARFLLFVAYGLLTRETASPLPRPVYDAVP